MELKVDNGAVLAYKRLPYKTWYAIAEFVDNSVDSRRRPGNNELMDEVFQQEGGILEVEIVLDKDQKILRIHDNSIGMSQSELTDAMVIGKTPAVSAGLSEFGMGMKTAAIWFADEINIRTKKYGEPNEIEITLNLEDFANGNSDLGEVKTPKDPAEHYTIVELRNIRRGLGVEAMKKTREFIGSIYRQDLRDGQLHITFNSEPVLPSFASGDSEFLQRQDGTPYRVGLHNIAVDGKQVSGWIGVLGRGSAGRTKAGFAIIRAGRAVRGYLDSWRPEQIFGDARNDTVNQRLTGELFVSDVDFKASHTKDAIDWEGNEEELLGEALRKFAEKYDLIKVAKKKFADDAVDPIEKDEAQDQLKAQFEDTDMVDEIQIVDVPSPAEVAIVTRVLPENATEALPLLQFKVGIDQMAFLYEVELSPNDPYFDFEVQANMDLKIYINGKHPAMNSLTTAEGRLAHYQHIVTEAIAEWKCAQKTSVLEPRTIRVLKDAYFRKLSTLESE